MVPILTRIRAKSAEEFGALVHHSGEEYIYVLKGVIKVLTEFYDPVVLRGGRDRSTSTATWATLMSPPRAAMRLIVLGHVLEHG